MTRTSLPRAALGFLAAITLMLPAWARPKDFVPRDSVALGRTYGEWAAQWQQWALSLPADAHPLFDTADCSAGQSGPVWFLGGQFCAVDAPSCPPPGAPRTCNVPEGTYLFFPVVNFELSGPEFLANVPGWSVPNLAAMRAFIAGHVDLTDQLFAIVDGVAIDDLKSDFRLQVPAFGYTLPPNDMLSALGVPGLSPGSYFPAVDDGVYVMLRPLKRGKHTIRFQARFPQFDFTIDTVYRIVVK